VRTRAATDDAVHVPRTAEAIEKQGVHESPVAGDTDEAHGSARVVSDDTALAASTAVDPTDDGVTVAAE